MNTKDTMSEEIQFDMLKPFGPRIGHVQCPDSIVDRLIELTDELVNTEDYESSGKNLVGVISHEPTIPLETLEEIGILSFFNNILNHYVLTVLKEQELMKEEDSLAIGVKAMWYVHQQAGEYNPLHHHTFCNISSVMYLDVPEMPKRNIPNKVERDGNITLVNHASWPESLNNGVFEIKPQRGAMYLWPSHLLHTVYPFLGNEIRKSIAWNGDFQLSNSEGQIILGTQ